MTTSDAIRTLLENMLSGPHDLQAAQWSGNAARKQNGVLLEDKKIRDSGGWSDLPAPPKATKLLARPQVTVMADTKATPVLVFAGKTGQLLLSGEEAALLAAAATAWQAGEQGQLRLWLTNKKAAGTRRARLSLFTPDWTQRRVTCTPDRVNRQLTIEVHQEDLNADDGRWHRQATWQLPFSALPAVQAQAEVLRNIRRTREMHTAVQEHPATSAASAQRPITPDTEQAT